MPSILSAASTAIYDSYLKTSALSPVLSVSVLLPSHPYASSLLSNMLLSTVSDLSKSDELSGLFKVLTTNESSVREVLNDIVTVLEGDSLEHVGDADEKELIMEESSENSANHSVDNAGIIDNSLNNSNGVKDVTHYSART